MTSAFTPITGTLGGSLIGMFTYITVYVHCKNDFEKSSPYKQNGFSRFIPLHI